MSTEMTNEATARKHSVLDSSFPVSLPYDASLFLPEAEFQTFVRKIVTDTRNPSLHELQVEIADIEHHHQAANLKRRASEKSDDEPAKKAPFLAGLERSAAHVRTEADLAADNKKLTENTDVTNISSNNSLVDLFHDLSESTIPENLKWLLERAWKEDPLMTLKIIFNARSIHLGKSSRITAYKALGWLADNHPLTLLANLRWLVRPIIAKKSPKPEKDGNGEKTKDDDEDFDMVEVEDTPVDPFKEHDVRFGVSHGYYKDLLNLVVFAANDQLKFDGDPDSLLTQKQEKKKRNWNQQESKELRQKKKAEQHERVVNKLENDGFYKALHFTVARLFVQQLKEDGELLKSGQQSDLKKLSQAAKWSPTHAEFHDKHTFILSSIAEALYPNAAEICPDANNRELYLRHAREAYRKNHVSPLRKALAVVERDITAETFKNINYEQLPSLAMQRYTPLFLRKDFERFSEYVNKVAEGSAKISGATLLPSTVIKRARKASHFSQDITGANVTAYKAAAEAKVTRQVIDGQWETLVQRVKHSGALNSSIAVCDVSGSMTFPTFKDGTTPIDTAIGLSLLVSEVTAPPFGEGFINFSETPTYISVGGPKDTRGLIEKVKQIEDSSWSMNTDFVAVFENLILSIAIHNKLTQEEMVKQVFVFSDMQFDSAQDGAERWTTSFERIKEKYAAAGYEMPRLIFWNLADSRSDKPVTNDDANTALVSGYSQGMLKVFLDGGGFEEEGEEEVVEEVVDDEGGMTEVKVKKKIDPLTLVKKAVSHKAYGMLEVVD